jgi:hypothetical protein
MSEGLPLRTRGAGRAGAGAVASPTPTAGGAALMSVTEDCFGTPVLCSGAPQSVTAPHRATPRGRHSRPKAGHRGVVLRVGALQPPLGSSAHSRGCVGGLEERAIQDGWGRAEGAPAREGVAAGSLAGPGVSDDPRMMRGAV